MIRLRSLILAAFSSFLLTGQSDSAASVLGRETANAALQLTNGTSRDWRFGRVQTLMAKGCGSNETWRFSADGKLVIETCKGGKEDRRSFNYRLKSEGAADILLQIDDPAASKYSIYFRDEPKETTLLLRRRAEEKSGATEDKLLRSPRKTP